MDFTQFSSYSETEQKTIRQIVNGNKNFYTSFGIADIPFADMEIVDENNVISVTPYVTASVSCNSNDYAVTLRKSNEQECWFITVSDGTNEYAGIVHYNTLLGNNGLFAFVVLNSNDGVSFDDITNTIQYSNFMILEK